MSSFRVVTWNAECMFVIGTKTIRASPNDAVATLAMVDADIVVIPEFGEYLKLTPETKKQIQELGYDVHVTDYSDPRAPGYGFAMLSKLPIVSYDYFDITGTGRKLHRLVCRLGIHRQVAVYGIHLDDRQESIRLESIRSIIETINHQPSLPTLLMGDFNAMHGRSIFARLVRTQLMKKLSIATWHKQLKDNLQRVQEMAIGTTIEYVQIHSRLHDLDSRSRPTVSAKQSGMEWAPKKTLAKIDWIFGTDDFRVLKYRVYHDVGSDHRPVVADLEFALDE